MAFLSDEVSCRVSSFWALYAHSCICLCVSIHIQLLLTLPRSAWLPHVPFFPRYTYVYTDSLMLLLHRTIKLSSNRPPSDPVFIPNVCSGLSVFLSAPNLTLFFLQQYASMDMDPFIHVGSAACRRMISFHPFSAHTDITIHMS